MKEKIKNVKIFLKAGEATMAPPLGPLLSKYSLNASLFIKQYNDLTKDLKGKTIPVLLNIYSDKTFEFKLLEQTTSDLLKNLFEKKIKEETSPVITYSDILFVVEKKKNEINTKNPSKAFKIICGTLKNMNIAYNFGI